MAAIVGILCLLVVGLAYYVITRSVEGRRGAALPSEKAKAHVKASFASRNVLVVNTLGMQFRLIRPGSFMMGSQDGPDSALPVSQVALTKPFYMGVHEVTQRQFKTLMGYCPAFKPDQAFPVEHISWQSAMEFCRRLSELEGTLYRLPTEAEWEYSCRAGCNGLLSFGDSPSELADYAWYQENSDGMVHPVGAKKPNAWGLHDMHGNAWEWCLDCLGPSYRNVASRDPKGPSQSGCWVLRGGTPASHGTCARLGSG